MAHPGGRPRYYESPSEMQQAIESYFQETPFDEITITGLALHLGFTSRQALIHYEGYSQEYFDTIKRAKLIVENVYERDLRDKGGSGPIFALKNFDWSDKQEIEHQGKMSVSFDAEDKNL